MGTKALPCFRRETECRVCSARSMAGMVQGVGGGRNDIGQQGNVADPAYVVQLVPVFQFFNECDHVNRLVFGVHIQHGLVNNLVHDPVKVLGFQDFRHLVHDIVVDEDGAKHTLLRFNILGGNAFLHGSISPFRFLL